MNKQYIAVIEMTSFFGVEQHIVRGNTAADLLDEFNEIQRLGCLVRMGRAQENHEGQKQLDILEGILSKKAGGTLTMEDLSALDIHLSVGDIRFLEAFSGENGLDELKKKYPKAR